MGLTDRAGAAHGTSTVHAVPAGGRVEKSVAKVGVIMAGPEGGNRAGGAARLLFATVAGVLWRIGQRQMPGKQQRAAE